MAKYRYKELKPRVSRLRSKPLKYAVVFGLNNSTTQVSLYAMTRTLSMAKQIVNLMLEQHPGRMLWILKARDLSKL